MVSLAELLDAARPFRVALRGEFRGVREREGLVLVGPHGAGEFAPFLEYDANLCARWLTAAVEQAFAVPLEFRRSEVAANAIVPGFEPTRAAAFARAVAAETGCTVFKIKVGDADSVARVRAVARELGTATLRLDANAAWDVPTACAALAELRGLPIDYVEQPCQALADCAKVRDLSGIRVAVDETLRLADVLDLDAIRRAVDVAVLKPTPLGGVRAALATAERLAMPITVSGALDTSLGLFTSMALAASLEQPPLASGLATGTLLASDLTLETTLPRGGLVRVTPPVLDLERLAHAGSAMPLARQAWWRARLTAAWHAGADRLIAALA
ncbi:MAG: O-succinylbenzoate synthase [Myxococcales bacterium]|nr:O-succinylbenzoate synthase [Myxococcales bacterium]